MSAGSLRRRFTRRPGATLRTGLAALLAGAACAGSPGSVSTSIQPWTMRERVERVELGQSAAQARALLGDSPVRRPGHPEQPFPSPRRSLELRDSAGEALRIELYVVAARRAEGCPDVHYEDVPIAFRGARVVARDWHTVESRWRSWGGDLGALRELQDRQRCPLADAAP